MSKGSLLMPFIILTGCRAGADGNKGLAPTAAGGFLDKFLAQFIHDPATDSGQNKHQDFLFYAHDQRSCDFAWLCR